MLAANTGSAGAVERLFWDKVPLRITLPIGKERLVSFPADVRVGIPPLINSKLRTQSNQGTVYWKANEAFDTQRIEIREIKSNRIYLIDLKASKKARSVTPIEVIFKDRRAGNEHRAGVQLNSASKKPRKPGYIGLTRFAAQQVYAPARLLKASANIHRVSIVRRPISHLMRGETIRATPVASWQSGSFYVTAVELRNTGSTDIALDPRLLRGDWRTATFQHVRLHPAGSESDTTAVYLISDRPFHEMVI
jgi:integrating conjugative element protein (TIGR03749 family)